MKTIEKVIKHIENENRLFNIKRMAYFKLLLSESVN